MSSAFDTLNHTILIHRLASIGILELPSTGLHLIYPTAPPQSEYTPTHPPPNPSPTECHRAMSLARSSLISTSSPYSIFLPIIPTFPFTPTLTTSNFTLIAQTPLRIPLTDSPPALSLFMIGSPLTLSN